jgi:L-alanine-DL-glutamate epimerase-like enolase superfamily enzyme
MRFIREHFSPEQVEIRVDANGAFDENEALIK